MSDDKKETNQDPKDPKAKFRDALEKKKQRSGNRNDKATGSPKISSGKANGKVLKMFRRKSGSN
jgi:hypothetical protein